MVNLAHHSSKSNFLLNLSATSGTSKGEKNPVAELGARDQPTEAKLRGVVSRP